MTKISVLIKTKNSENTICETLESVKKFDEIIIIDEHSTDDTLEFAKEYKARVIYALYPEFELAFNQALSEALGDWILILEPDEIIPQNLFLELQKTLQKVRKNKTAFFINRKVFYFEKEVKSQGGAVLRLLKRGCFKINNDFSIELFEGKKSKIKNKNCSILKYYKNDILKQTLKTVDDVRIEAKNYSKKIDLIKPIKIFLYFYFLKKGFLDGTGGVVFAYLKAQKEFLFQTLIQEKTKEG